jgi:hypothetical protein
MFDWGTFFAVFLIFSVLWIVGQRIAKRHQHSVRIAIVVLAAFWLWARVLIYPWEMILGLVASLFISFLFWILIGRYNPVGNPDDEQIKVYGLND